MRNTMGKKGRVRPKRILAALLAVVQLILLLPTVSIPVLAAGDVVYTRLKPEVAIYNAQTGIDEKLYNREISASSTRPPNAACSTCPLKTIWSMQARRSIWITWTSANCG